MALGVSNYSTAQISLNRALRPCQRVRSHHSHVRFFLKNSAVHDLRGYGLCPAPDGAARSDRQQFQLEYRCDIKRGHARDRGGGRWYVVWCAGGGVDRRSSTPRSRCMVKRGAGKRVAVAHLIIGLVAYTKHKASMDYLAYTFTLLSRT